MIYKQLGDKLQECGAVKFGDFALANGEKSKYYIDIKKAVTKPNILGLICKRIIYVMADRNIQPDYIACVELGGVPIGTMVSFITRIDLLIIRKEQKDHGLKGRIIGDHEKSKTVLLVEDVTTSGGSIISAVNALRNEGLVVRTVISIVDRDEGARDAFDKEGLELISLVEVKTILEDYEIADALRRKENI